MENYDIYRDIQLRTGGDIYIGVVGPVRTGKSTFIRRFMELTVLSDLKESAQKELRDQLPLSSAGKIITTIEPKFIPKEAVPVLLGKEQKIKVKLIDCVGFLVKDAAGHVEDGKERMVKTPWIEHPIPFQEAAKLGTEKVISEHSTIGLVITSDGSFGEIERSNFLEAESQAIMELKKQNKPFLIIVNSQKPFKDETQQIVKELETQYHVSAMALNCEQLRKEDISIILEKILYEFPVSEIRFFIPKWVEMLTSEHIIKQHMLLNIKKIMKEIQKIKDAKSENIHFEGPYVLESIIEHIDLSNGVIRIRLQMEDKFYYQMLSETLGITVESEYDLIHTLRTLSRMKENFDKVQNALESVKEHGYGIVIPELDEILLDDPEVIRQGNKYGVKIKSKSPSIHMIKAHIETEIAPIVGTEQQAKDLIQYISDSDERGERIWDTNIFGKSIEELVREGIQNKVLSIGEESQIKLQETMQKIVNDSKGGLVCIII